MGTPLGFKTFNTGDVLTAADTNGYLMQGVWTFANAAARTAAVTSPQEGNMSYLKDTNSTEYYDGSSWVAIAGASGGMTLISTTTLTGSSVTLTSIPQTYKALKIYIRNPLMATSGWGLFMRYNADSTANRHITNALGSSAYGTPGWNATKVLVTFDNGSNTLNYGLAEVDLPDYANSTTWKMNFSYSVTVSDSTPGIEYQASMGAYNQQVAITSLQFLSGSGNLTSGTIYLYGVN